jgi:hypothetical protein
MPMRMHIHILTCMHAVGFVPKTAKCVLVRYIVPKTVLSEECNMHNIYINIHFHIYSFDHNADSATEQQAYLTYM